MISQQTFGISRRRQTTSPQAMVPASQSHLLQQTARVSTTATSTEDEINVPIAGLHSAHAGPYDISRPLHLTTSVSEHVSPKRRKTNGAATASRQDLNLGNLYADETLDDLPQSPSAPPLSLVPWTTPPRSSNKRANDEVAQGEPSISTTQTDRPKKAAKAKRSTTIATKPTQARRYSAFPAAATSLAQARSLNRTKQYMLWQPPTPTVPTTDAQKLTYAKRLYNAVVDMSSVQLPLGKSRCGNRLILEDKYDENYIALRCYEVVDYTVDLHQHGCISPTFADRTYDVKAGKEVFDKHYRGTPAGPISYRQLTLDDRIDDMENALRQDKLVAQDVLDGQVNLGYALVLAPGQSLKLKKTFSKQNKLRGQQSQAQKQENAELLAEKQLLQQQLLELARNNKFRLDNVFSTEGFDGDNNLTEDASPNGHGHSLKSTNDSEVKTQPLAHAQSVEYGFASRHAVGFAPLAYGEDMGAQHAVPQIPQNPERVTSRSGSFTPQSFATALHFPNYDGVQTTAPRTSAPRQIPQSHYNQHTHNFSPTHTLMTFDPSQQDSGDYSPRLHTNDYGFQSRIDNGSLQKFADHDAAQQLIDLSHSQHNAPQGFAVDSGRPSRVSPPQNAIKDDAWGLHNVLKWNEQFSSIDSGFRPDGLSSDNHFLGQDNDLQRDTFSSGDHFLGQDNGFQCSTFE